MKDSLIKSTTKRYRAERRIGLWFTLPALITMAATVLYPIIWSFKISLFESKGMMTSGPFVGLENYIYVLKSKLFQEALWQTIGFVAATIFIELVLGFAIALVLNRNLPGSKLFRILFTLPLMISMIVAGLQWRWLFADQYGVINNIIGSFGIEGPLWLGSVWGARASVLLANVWLAAPFSILVLLAALAALSDDLYEAARLDGANSFQMFWRITLPLLKPTILLILVLRLSDSFRLFDLVYIMTNGGPGGSTEVLSTFIYKNTFTNLNFGTGAAASFLVMILIMVICFILFKILRPKEVPNK
ncbi:sugar ABC transporter permease [Bacillus timonensis]|uniref:Sugar ABC transporter permease n=1 Tax=Bacillus timonensis TaxID=1033734 RepID=A0A4S3PQG6_9BACI|nr:sugar ABC transporter permease [Bacillus timonensis]THE11849.1 sugar ABC transporter permease [Bacillus timonensis]